MKRSTETLKPKPNQVRNNSIINKNIEFNSIYKDDPIIGPLINNFLINLPEKIDQLKKHHSQRDFPQMKRLTHQLKGALLSYGFRDIGNVFINLKKKSLRASIEMN